MTAELPGNALGHLDWCERCAAVLRELISEARSTLSCHRPFDKTLWQEHNWHDVTDCFAAYRRELDDSLEDAEVNGILQRQPYIRAANVGHLKAFKFRERYGVRTATEALWVATKELRADFGKVPTIRSWDATNRRWVDENGDWVIKDRIAICERVECKLKDYNPINFDELLARATEECIRYEDSLPSECIKPRLVSAGGVAKALLLERKSMTRYEKHWPKPVEPSRGRRPALYDLDELMPILKRQFQGRDLSPLEEFVSL